MGHPLHAEMLLFLGTKKPLTTFKKNMPELISQ